MEKIILIIHITFLLLLFYSGNNDLKGYDLSGEDDDGIVQRFKNLDITSIVSPVNAFKLKDLLLRSKYDPEEIDFLISGFTQGFDIGYQGPTDRQDRSKNLPFRIGNERILWNKLMKEVKAKRVAGPFSESDIPFTNYVQLPLGLVPKQGNKARMIFHLSYDFH